MEPDPDQLQLIQVAPELPSRIAAGELPRYEDIVLTAEQVEAARAEWPDKKPTQQAAFMKMRILAKLRHEIVADPVTGRRAFGGVQPGSGTPKKKRLDEQLVEAADRRVQEIIDAAFAPLSPDNKDLFARHKAAMNISKEAREIRKLELAEDDLERADNVEVKNLAVGVIADLIRSGELKLEDLSASIIDADVVET